MGCSMLLAGVQVSIQHIPSWAAHLRLSLLHRDVLADYGTVLMLVAFSGLAFAVSTPAGGVPQRVNSPSAWDAGSNWTVVGVSMISILAGICSSFSCNPAISLAAVQDMGKLGPGWIAAAAVPALLITILFFFDHNVSAQLAQQPEFNLRKPSAYHWDFMLLGEQCTGSNNILAIAHCNHLL